MSISKNIISGVQKLLQLDWLFPYSPHGLLISEYGMNNLDNEYQPLLMTNIISLSSYKSPIIKSCIAACKFEHNNQAMLLLGTLVKKYIVTIDDKIILIPVPLHKKRERERYYNQVSEVLKIACKTLPHCRIEESLIKRKKNTLRQTSLNKKDRMKNIVGAFTYHGQSYGWSEVNQVIICDDVTTTGSTLKEAHSIIKNHLPSHIKLTLLAFAR